MLRTKWPKTSLGVCLTQMSSRIFLY